MLPLLVVLAVPGLDAAGAGAIDYQKMAREARWQPPEQGDDFRRCLAHELNDYQVEVVRRKGDRWEVTLRILDNGQEVHSWQGHLDTVFFERDGTLYYADFHPHSTGCAVVAYDLKARRLRWTTQLRGIGPVSHSKYFNTVRLERVNDEVLAVYGKESFGRYVEFVDLRTGRIVGHKVFSDRD
jgi:hypothetical protein